MVRFLLKRAVWGLITLFAFVSIMFFAVQLSLPNDFTAQFALSMSPQDRQALLHALGLDLPMWQRYLDWLGELVRLDLGISYSGIAVFDSIMSALPYSLLVFFAGTVVAFLIGHWLGKWSAWRGPGLSTRIVTLIALALYTSFPPWLAYLVTYALVPRVRGFVMVYPYSIRRWLYAAGLSISGFQSEFSARPTTLATYIVLSLLIGTVVLVFLDRLLRRLVKRRLPTLPALLLLLGGVIGSWHVFGFEREGLALVRVASLPTVTFVLLIFAETMLIMSASMIDTLGEEYITTARAKGLSESVVRDKHAARNAILPVLARLVVTLPYLLTGIVIIENVFGWPGLGTILWGAILWQDIPLMMGVFLFIGLFSLTARLVLDVLHAYLDPRLRFSGGQEAGSRRERVATQLIDMKSLLSSLFNIGRVRRLRQSIGATWRRFKIAWQVFARSRLALLGMALLVTLLLMAIAHPILLATVWPRGIYDPVTGYDLNIAHPSKPSFSHLLGTQITGIDIFSLLLVATRNSFTLGLTAGIVAAVIGVAIGVLAAYFRGNTDIVLSKLSDVFLLLPAPIFMAFVGAVSKSMGPFTLGVIYGLIAGIGSTAILMRTYALTIMAKSYIKVAQVAGGSAVYIIIRHVLTAMLPMVVLQMLLVATGAVVADGFLSFIGVTRYVVNWGTMLAVSERLHEAIGGGTQWWAILPPVIAFSLFGLAFYLVSRGMHLVAEPRLRER